MKEVMVSREKQSVDRERIVVNPTFDRGLILSICIILTDLAITKWSVFQKWERRAEQTQPQTRHRYGQLTYDTILSLSLCIIHHQENASQNSNGILPHTNETSTHQNSWCWVRWSNSGWGTNLIYSQPGLNLQQSICSLQSLPEHRARKKPWEQSCIFPLLP